MTTTTKPKVLIELKGGMLYRITSTEDMDFILIDYKSSPQSGEKPAFTLQRQSEILPHDLMADKAERIIEAILPAPF